MPYQRGHIQTLEKVQKRLARSCQPAPRGELSYQTRLQKLDLTSLENRFQYLAIAFSSKCLYNVYDINPFDYISINIRHTQTLKFHHNYARTDCLKYNVFNRFPVNFENLPANVRDKLLVSLQGFLSNCKQHFKLMSWQDQF
jgi:hypothetical protein